MVIITVLIRAVVCNNRSNNSKVMNKNYKCYSNYNNNLKNNTVMHKFNDDIYNK